MAVNTLKCSHLMPLYFKGLSLSYILRVCHYFRQGDYVFVSGCPSVRLSVSGMTRKVFRRFSWKLVELWTSIMGKNTILGLILFKMTDWRPLWIFVCMALVVTSSWFMHLDIERILGDWWVMTLAEVYF